MSTFRRRQLSSAFPAQPPELKSGGTPSFGRRSDPLDLIAIAPLMGRSDGGPDVIIGLIDGPVLLDHPDLANEHIREISAPGGACMSASSSACQHGTFVAGILSA